MVEGVAACAVRPERLSVSTCSRCGRFCCGECGRASPCLECQLRQREACPRLSPVLDRIIGVCAVLYAICTVAIVPAMAPIDWFHFKAKDLTSAPVIAATVIETVYSAVALVLMAVWLVWFVVLHDWAKARAIEVPGKATAIAGCFVCIMNFFHPLLTLLKVRRGTGVQTPLELWWGLTWVSVILATVRMPAVMRGGYDALFIAASAMEVGGVLLCWKITRDFRLADHAWDPRAQAALRG